MARRLYHLAEEREGARVLTALAGQGLSALAALETIAKLNADQAEAAFRRCFVFNLTLPLAFIAAAFQIAPELQRFYTTGLGESPLVAVFLVGSLLAFVGTVLFVFFKSRDARDLADLITLARLRAETASQTSTPSALLQAKG